MCIHHTRYEYGKYLKIFHGILSIPHNNVMDLNYVMDLVMLNRTFPFHKIRRDST